VFSASLTDVLRISPKFIVVGLSGDKFVYFLFEFFI